MNKAQFASDNYAGACPESLDLLCQANSGFQVSYGDDSWTAEASDRFREIFENDCEVFFVFNGTAANSLALAALCQSYHSIIAHELAHIETDECGGPEFFSNGSKILLGNGKWGKLRPEDVEPLIIKRQDIHYPKPKVLSLTQSTEMGTVYSVEELHDLDRLARKYQLKTHMDGARFANAVASLGCKPSEITWKAGVDVLCFGGAKNGIPLGEAVIFFDKSLAEDFAYRCKQAGQLASKMRFLSAPWLGLLRDDVWLKNAAHANECAAYLYESLREIPEIEFAAPCQANGVFFSVPSKVIEILKSKGWVFYTFIGQGTVRLMCSWNSDKKAVDALIWDLKNALVSQK